MSEKDKKQQFQHGKKDVDFRSKKTGIAASVQKKRRKVEEATSSIKHKGRQKLQQGSSSSNKPASSQGGVNLQQHPSPLSREIRTALKRQSSNVVDSSLSVNEDAESLKEVKSELDSSRYTLKRTVDATRTVGNLTDKMVTRATLPTKFDVSGQREVFRQTRRRVSSTAQKFSKQSTQIAAKKAQELARASAQAVAKTTKKALAAVVKLPPWLWGIVAGGGLLLVVLLSAASFGVNVQNEYDLNQTYAYLTKLDREKSNDDVSYWTDWSDTSHYISYQYDNLEDVFKFRVEGSIPDNDLGVVFLKQLWDDLNADKSNLKTIKDLYTKKYSIYELKDSALEEYQEILDTESELGKFPSLQELQNPFYPEDSTEADEAIIRISDRFGYTSKDELSTKTTLEIASDKMLYAPLDGKVTIDDGNVTLAQDDAKFTFFNVSGIRVKDQANITSGTEIGKTSESTGQVISYQKKLTFKPKSSVTNLFPKEEEKWVYVNPGFYFKHVSYNQKTQIKTSISVDADKAQRVAFIYNYFSKNVPSTTIKGIAVALGNWDVENDINPKRAEGDYLAPPIGATDSSWDDDTWLNMSGPQIYSGIYPNILHRGIGMGQFTDTADGSVRATMLRDFAKAKGKKWYDLELQLEFMLNGDNPASQAYLKTTLINTEMGIDDLTNYFLTYWEGNPGNKLATRQEAARKWEIYLTNLLSGNQTGKSSSTVPAEYKDKLPYGLPSDQAITQGQGYPGNNYALGNCTWYVYNRFYQIGQPIYGALGNAGDWVTSSQAQGYRITSEPRAGAAVVFLPGVAGAHPQFGHVGFCEYVNSDGSFLMSDMNGVGGLFGLSWSTLRAQNGIYFISPK